MNQKELLEEIKNYTLQNIPYDDIHGYGHTERVYHMCIEIGKKLGANLFVLEIAALLHDIGRFSEDFKHRNKNHAEISANLASKYLQTIDFRFNKTDFENIIHCIHSHSFSNQKLPKTLEAKILSDVDKLDALGAIGLYRTIGYTTKMDGTIQDVFKHLEDKILILKEQLFLDISKDFAQKRFEIIERFYQELKNELKAEKT
jgi:uncharacterized protein